jgi:hypothetical protein
MCLISPTFTMKRRKNTPAFSRLPSVCLPDHACPDLSSHACFLVPAFHAYLPLQACLRSAYLTPASCMPPHASCLPLQPFHAFLLSALSLCEASITGSGQDPTIPLLTRAVGHSASESSPMQSSWKQVGIMDVIVDALLIVFYFFPLHFFVSGLSLSGG